MDYDMKNYELPEKIYLDTPEDELHKMCTICDEEFK